MKIIKIKKSTIIGQIIVAICIFSAGFGLHMFLTKNRMNGWSGAGEITVSVQHLEHKDLTDKKKFIATVEAIKSVDIVPQVSGYIQEVKFKDGSFVNKDDVLFVIEQTKFIANVQAAEADLEKAKSDFEQISSNYNREKVLFDEKLIAKAELEIAENKLNQAKASIKQAEANLTLAQINLGYTEIKAPISGYIGKAVATEGNYVNPSVPSLARIVQTDPIRIAFSVSDKDRLTFLENVHAKNMDTHFEIVHPNKKTVEVKAENFFADNQINPETVTLPVYLDHANPDNALIPGNYVDILVSHGGREKSLVVPLVAIAQDINGSYVMLVDDDNKVKQVYVELGRQIGNSQEVLSGLKDSDKVIVQGLQKVQDGVTVKPILVK